MVELFKDGGSYSADKIVFEYIADSLNATEDTVSFGGRKGNDIRIIVNRKVIQDKFMLDVTFSLARELKDQAAHLSDEEIQTEIENDKKGVVQSFMPYIVTMIVSLANTIGGLPLFITPMELVE